MPSRAAVAGSELRPDCPPSCPGASANRRKQGGNERLPDGDHSGRVLCGTTVRPRTQDASRRAEVEVEIDFHGTAVKGFILQAACRVVSICLPNGPPKELRSGVFARNLFTGNRLHRIHEGKIVSLPTIPALNPGSAAGQKGRPGRTSRGIARSCDTWV